MRFTRLYRLREEEWRLAFLALAVRIVLLLTATFLDGRLLDYDTSKYITPVEGASAVAGYGVDADVLRIPHQTAAESRRSGVPHGNRVAVHDHLSGWAVWDSVFFLDIAARGYVFEQYYAFFPLYPWLLSLAPSAVRVLAGVTLNAGASMLGTVLLYRLGERLTRSKRHAAVACLFFIFNPAAIFHAAPYTESAFAAATLAALYCLYCRDRLLPAVAAVAVSCGLRSNGIVNAGYIGHYCLSLAVAEWPSRKARALRLALLGFLAAAASVSPLVLFQWAAYSAFCQAATGGDSRSNTSSGGGSSQDAAPLHPLAGAPGTTGGDSALRSWPRPWCSSRLPYVYGFVQAQYWNVGFLRYYTVQQLPNFLLAAPVLLVSVAGLAEYCRANARRVLTMGLAPPPPDPATPVPALTDATTPPASALTHTDAGPQSTAEDSEADAAPSLSEQCAGLSGGSALRRRQRKLERPEAADGGEAAAAAGRGEPGVCRGGDAEPGGAGVGDAGGGGGACATADDGAAGMGFLRPELTVFMFPWAFSVAVALTAMHVQVATRLILSACPPVYWFMAHVWLSAAACGGDRTVAGVDGSGVGALGGDVGRGAGGAWLRRERRVPLSGRRWRRWCAVGLWRWCFTYTALGCVLFVNFMPWT